MTQLPPRTVAKEPLKPPLVKHLIVPFDDHAAFGCVRQTFEGCPLFHTYNGGQIAGSLARCGADFWRIFSCLYDLHDLPDWQIIGVVICNGARGCLGSLSL